MAWKSDRTPKRQRTAETPFVSVQRPAAHQGVGDALRAAYAMPHEAIPADFKVLLQRLDCRR